MSKAFLFDDVEPAILELHNADKLDMDFIEQIGAYALNETYLGGIAYEIGADVLQLVKNRWPYSTVTRTPIIESAPIRHQVVQTNDKYL